MRSLFIGPGERDRIAKLIELAKLNPFKLNELKEAVGTTGEDLRRWKIRLDPFTMSLPTGFTVTYTREFQPYGLCHRRSTSW